jgi:signal transduction histidine kinase
VIIPNLAAEPNMPAAMRALESRALLVAPLQTGSQLLGVLGILRHATREFSSRDLALIAVIANQLGIAIQSQSLREQAKQIALLEERQRLARDLHDSVTQSLYSVTLFAQAIRSATYTGNLPLTQQYVNRLSEMAQQALKEMRWLIYELRPALIEEVGLVNALQRRLELVERRAGVAVEFESKAMQELDTALENSIYQIAQEALNNTLKHAGATFITVRMSMDARHFRLEIQDDGKGFDLVAVKETAGLGLASMQERAAQLGGTLTITTKPGQGTRIQLNVPHSKEPSP